MKERARWGTNGDNIVVQHHESEATIPFKGIVDVEPDDNLSLPLLLPKVTRDGSIVLVGFPVSFYTTVELALCYCQPADEALERDIRFVASAPDKVNDGIAGVMENPAAG